MTCRPIPKSATCISVMCEPLLAVSEIHTYYGDSYVLQGVSLALGKGSIAVILGRNGMGKTTLIRSIAGLTPPRTGEIAYRGRSLRGRPPYAIAQGGIAIVPQGRRIFRSLSVRENLLLPTSVLARASRPPQEGGSGQRWDFDEVLKEFPQLAERIDHRGAALSGGEQQMLAIGRALMANPELILMDEPSEGLAPRLVLQVQEIMRRLRGRGHAILLVEQNLELAMSVADEVFVLSSGRFVFRGTAGSAGAGDAGARSASRRIGSEADVTQEETSMPTHHTLAPSPSTVHWGYLDAKIPPRLTVDSGDTVTIETVSGGLADVGDTSIMLPHHREICEKLKPSPGPHILTGPVAVRGARAGRLRSRCASRRSRSPSTGAGT